MVHKSISQSAVSFVFHFLVTFSYFVINLFPFLFNILRLDLDNKQVKCVHLYCALPLYRDQFSPITLQQTSHSSPVRARFGVSVVSFKSDSLSGRDGHASWQPCNTFDSDKVSIS